MRYFWYAVGGCRVYVAIGGNPFPISQNLFLLVLGDRRFLLDIYGMHKLQGRIDQICRSAALHSPEHLDDVQDVRGARRDWRSPVWPRPRARERNERRLSSPRRCTGVHAPHTNRRITKGGQGIHVRRVQRIFFNGTNRVILQWASGVFTFGLTIDGTMFPSRRIWCW